MKCEIFYFKKLTVVLNLILCCCFFLAGIYLASYAILNLKSTGDLWPLFFALLFLWFAFFEFGYELLLSLPGRIAFELHQDHIVVCSAFGSKVVPKKFVKGCKKVVHRLHGGPKAGVVEISVADKFKVLGPYGRKRNPSFYGASVAGESEQSIVNKIRKWRK